MAKAPQTRKLTLVAIGQVTDRTCKTGRVKFSFDPTPDAFLLKSKARETPVAVLITPDEQHKAARWRWSRSWSRPIAWRIWSS